MRRIAILGSTGSIGKRTLDVIDHLGGFLVQAISCHKNVAFFQEQVQKYRPKLLGKSLEEIVTSDEVDEVVIAIAGSAAILPTLAAIRAKKRVMLASKEVLVMAGAMIMEEVKKSGATFIPIDSEHSSLFAMLHHIPEGEIERLILTASGGPFWQRCASSLATITREEALLHPRWKMGAKITVDSSTLMNKGLEVIEAHHLFQVPIHKIDVLIHPESIVHALVQLKDGTMLAHLGQTDMALAIQYALTFPKRVSSFLEPLDLVKMGRFEFYSPDVRKFPCLGIAIRTAVLGGAAPCHMNAINEVLVVKFLLGKIRWQEIGTSLERLMESAPKILNPTLDELLQVDAQARELAT